VQGVLEDHAANHSADALFLVWSMHLVHMPLQVPTAYFDQFPFILNQQRRRMHAMVAYLDAEVGSVVAELRRGRAWDRTLVVLHSDVRSGSDRPCQPLPVCSP